MSNTPSKFKFVTSTTVDPKSSPVYTAELNEDGKGYTVTWVRDNTGLDPSTQYDLSSVKKYLGQGDWIIYEDLSEDEEDGELIYEVWLQTENRWGELTKEVYEYLKANFAVRLRTLKVIEQV